MGGFVVLVSLWVVLIGGYICWVETTQPDTSRGQDEFFDSLDDAIKKNFPSYKPDPANRPQPPEH